MECECLKVTLQLYGETERAVLGVCSAVAIKWLCPRSCGPVRNTAVHVDVRAEMIFMSYEFFTHGKKLLV